MDNELDSSVRRNLLETMLAAALLDVNLTRLILAGNRLARKHCAALLPFGLNFPCDLLAYLASNPLDKGSICRLR